MTRSKDIADLIGALKDLLALPDGTLTGDAARIRRAVKHRARQVIEQYDEDAHLIERAARMNDLFLEVYSDGQVGRDETRKTDELTCPTSK